MLIYKVFFIILKIGFYLNVVGYKDLEIVEEQQPSLSFI